MSTLDQRGEPRTPTAEQIAAALNDLHLAVNFHKPYLSTEEAATYTGRTVKAFYDFLRRHRIVRMGDGTICRRDLDRIKRQKFAAKGRPSRQHAGAR